MHRVLSFQMGMSRSRGFGESSEFVTKRMCFSFIFFFGFLALLGGFLFGRMSTERNIKLREERKRLELANDVLEVTGRPQIQYNILLQELRNTSFEKSHITDKSWLKNTTEDINPVAYLQYVKNILSDSNSFFHENIKESSSTIIATHQGSQEPDRLIILSISGDGTILALELVKIFEKLKIDHNWEPRRTIIFCFSYDPNQDSCSNILSKYFKSRIIAYLVVRGNAIQKKGCLLISGSDIIKSVVFGTVQESISAFDFHDKRVFDSCEIGSEARNVILMPRILSDIPHASLSFKTSDSTIEEFDNETEILPYRKILTHVIGLSIWKLSESVILRWDPKVFERDVKTALKMINSPEFSEVEGKILTTVEKLVNSAENLNERIKNELENSCSLASRMTNDLLMDLDRELLCPDIDSRSKTDLASIPGLLSKSQETMSSFLVNILKCYEDTIEMLQQG